MQSLSKRTKKIKKKEGNQIPEKILLLKVNCVTTSLDQGQQTTYNINEEGFLNKITQQSKIENQKQNIIKQIQNAVNSIIDKLEESEIKNIYEQLKIATTTEQLLTAMGPILKKLYENNPKRFQEQKELSIAISLKKFMFKYFQRKLKSQSKEKVKQIYASLVKEENPTTILAQLGETYDPTIPNNGLISLSIKTLIKAITISQKHLCIDCSNADIIHCPKIKDRHKKNIQDYSFIIDGYQKFDQNGNLEEFVVTQCHNFQSNKKTVSWTKKRELIDSITTLYYETATVEEAIQLEKEQYQKGLIKKYTAK